MKKKAAVFWAARAKKYDKLEWANKGDYLHMFLNAGQFHEDDIVLDVGTGTGIIAHTVAPFVKKVVGIDISLDMLKHAHDDPTFHNVEFHRMDAHAMKFRANLFHKVTARMCFHHIIEHTQKAMNECFRVLKKRGRMIFSEGVPPTKHVVPFYTEMFKLKEKRITFMEEDLERLMRSSGFRDIQKKIFWVRHASIRNWLENSGLSKAMQDKIFQMHIDLDARGKSDYNMKIEDGDCFIDMKFVILNGGK